MVKENQQCIACGAGHYRRILQAITLETQHGNSVTIPDVELFKCDVCGDEVVSAASHNYIDRRIAEEDEHLSPADVRESFDTLGDTLSEISDTIGIGSKTPGRWLSGSQHPIKALGFYLRVLAEFPETYKWLKERGWRKSEPAVLRLTFGANGRVIVDGHEFEDLEQRAEESPAPWAQMGNFAKQFRDAPYRGAGRSLVS